MKAFCRLPGGGRLDNYAPPCPARPATTEKENRFRL